MALNVGGGVSGAVSGAYLGSSILPGWGTAIGAIAGGTLGLFGGKNKRKKPKKYSTLDERQQGIYGNYADAIEGKGPLANLYNFDEQRAGDVFDQTVARPEMRRFQEDVMPGITGNFRGKNLQNSSYLGQALGKAGRDVSEKLSGLRSQQMYEGQRQSQRDKQNAIDRILNMQTFAYDQPEGQAPSGIDSIIGSVGSDAGSWLKDYIGSKTSGAAGTSGAVGNGSSSLAGLFA